MSPSRCPRQTRGFTLAEVLIALTVAVLVVSAVCSLLVTTGTVFQKNRMLANAADATRLVEQTINREMSIAVSQGARVGDPPNYVIRPIFSDSNAAGTRYGTITYRVSVGAPAQVITLAHQSDHAVTIRWPAGSELPQAGDYFVLDALSLGSTDAAGNFIAGIPIDSVTGTGDITVTMYQNRSISTYNLTPSNTNDLSVGTVVLIQRESRMETTGHPVASDPNRYELWWYRTTYSPTADPPTHQPVSQYVDASNRWLFASLPQDQSLAELGISWQFNYRPDQSDITRFLAATGNRQFYQTNYAEGVVMPKSGNPLNSTNGTGTTYTNALSTTTLASSSTTTAGTSSTTTAGTSSTTTKGTSSTTTNGTSSTTTNGTSSTTTKGTSSTTTNGTSSSTTTNGTSSTTTKGTSSTTTKGSSSSTSTNGTSSTTTKGTSSTSTKGTSSTTTAGTSSTSTKGTSSTTTAGTSSTSTAGTSSTTTKGTSSTTTAGTSSTTTKGSSSTTTAASSSTTTKGTTTIASGD